MTERVHPSAAAEPKPMAPGLLHRVATMVYEAVLLFGVVVVANLPVVVVLGWRHPLSDSQRAVLQLVSFVAIGAYFVYCWTRGGQTLAMRSWRVQLVSSSGSAVTPVQALLRYLLAWHLFVPGIAMIVTLQLRGAAAAAALALSFLGLLLTMYAGSDRQLLHDRLLGLRVIHRAKATR